MWVDRVVVVCGGGAAVLAVATAVATAVGDAVGNAVGDATDVAVAEPMSCDESCCCCRHRHCGKNCYHFRFCCSDGPQLPCQQSHPRHHMQAPPPPAGTLLVTPVLAANLAATRLTRRRSMTRTRHRPPPAARPTIRPRRRSLPRGPRHDGAGYLDTSSSSNTIPYWRHNCN